MEKGGIGILFFGAAIPPGIKNVITNDVALGLSSNCLIIEPKSNKKWYCLGIKFWILRKSEFRALKLLRLS